MTNHFTKNRGASILLLAQFGALSLYLASCGQTESEGERTSSSATGGANATGGAGATGGTGATGGAGAMGTECSLPTSEELTWDSLCAREDNVDWLLYQACGISWLERAVEPTGGVERIVLSEAMELVAYEESDGDGNILCSAGTLPECAAWDGPPGLGDLRTSLWGFCDERAAANAPPNPFCQEEIDRGPDWEGWCGAAGGFDRLVVGCGFIELTNSAPYLQFEWIMDDSSDELVYVSETHPQIEDVDYDSCAVGSRPTCDDPTFDSQTDPEGFEAEWSRICAEKTGP